MKKALCIGLLICFIAASFWVYLISKTGSKVVNGIFVSELLIVVSEERFGIDFCRLLEKATTNDTNAIKQLTLLEFYDSASYEHGEIIVSLIELIGEEEFIHIFADANDEQKKRITATIEIGLVYGKNELQNRTLKETFPKVYDFLEK